MKYKTTQKAVIAGYDKKICIGYCNLQNLLRFQSPVAYTSGREGWKDDIYEVAGNNAIITGYQPFGDIRPDYDTQQRYESAAMEIISDYNTPWDEKEEKTTDLLNKFVQEVTK